MRVKSWGRTMNVASRPVICLLGLFITILVLASCQNGVSSHLGVSAQTVSTPDLAKQGSQNDCLTTLSGYLCSSSDQVVVSAPPEANVTMIRSEERRVGKECRPR